MNKKIFSVLIALLFTPSLVFAGHIGGLSQNLGGQMLTINADVGFKKQDVERGNITDELSSRSFVIKATYGMQDRLDVFLNVGFADIQDIQTFDGSLGTLIGGGFKYLLFGPGQSTQVSIYGSIEGFESKDSGRKADVLGYDLALMVSNKSGNFTPYGGLKFSDLEVDIAGMGEYDAKDNFGLFAGVDYFVNPNVFFTGEVHIFNENTLYFGAGYNF
jgi:hypothetical protein